MMPSLNTLRLSARDVDPLSWFTGPFVPVIFGTVVAVYGTVMAIVMNMVGSGGLLQIIGVALCAVACALVQGLTMLRVRVDNGLGMAAVGVGGAGLIVSAAGYSTEVLAIEHWWAPFCFALVFACIVPYLSVWRILGFGLLALTTVIPIAYVLVLPRVEGWGHIATFFFVATPTMVAIAGGAAFSSRVVSQVLPIVDNRSTGVVSELLEVDPEVETAERASLAMLTARAVPFLRTIAERGTVEPHDRVVAGEIARYLRDDLVSRSDLAWLGLRADDRRVVMIDPDRRADALRAPQRDAIRDLVRVVLDDPSTDATTLLIELRAEADGSTAVAMTLDTDRPEGRRVQHVAPYYFNLRGEMRDVRLGRGSLSFRVPPAEEPQRPERRTRRPSR